MGKVDNFNVPVEDVVAREFEKWAITVSGKKGDKLTAALKAVQALHSIDCGLYFYLTGPNVTIKDATDKIIQSIVGLEAREFLDSLTPAERKRVLLDAKAHKGRVSRKK